MFAEEFLDRFEHDLEDMGFDIVGSSGEIINCLMCEEDDDGDKQIFEITFAKKRNVSDNVFYNAEVTIFFRIVPLTSISIYFKVLLKPHRSFFKEHDYLRRIQVTSREQVGWFSIDQQVNIVGGDTAYVGVVDLIQSNLSNFEEYVRKRFLVNKLLGRMITSVFKRHAVYSKDFFEVDVKRRKLYFMFNFGDALEEQSPIIMKTIFDELTEEKCYDLVRFLEYVNKKVSVIHKV